MKKAFTLIELLAIIIILAVIALIATPIVLNVIEKSKLESNRNSVYGLIDTGRLYYAESLLDDTKYSNINGKTNLLNIISYNGKKPTTGSMYINESGEIKIAVIYDKVCFVKDYEASEVTIKEIEDESECTLEPTIASGEIWDGYITLTLYYPEESTERMWRLALPGEVREEGWQEYTGSIIVPLSRVEDIYIKYTLNGKEYMQPPRTNTYVSIEPEKYIEEEGKKVKVRLIYDPLADSVKYKVGDAEWLDYEGEFEVSSPTLIQAKVSRRVTTYNTDGSILYDETLKEMDAVQISIPEKDQPLNPPVPSNPPGPTDPPYKCVGSTAPVISLSTSDITNKVNITITTQNEYKQMYYKIGNGSWTKYEGSFDIYTNTVIYAKYIDSENLYSCMNSAIIDNIKNGELPYIKISTSPSNVLDVPKVNEVEVNIESDTDNIEYSMNGVEYTKYTTSFKVETNGRIYARATNEYGTKTSYIDIINTKKMPPERKKLSVSITTNPNTDNEKVEKSLVTINYDTRTTKKYYRINDGELLIYTKPFEVEETSKIEAYAVSDESTGTDSKIVYIYKKENNEKPKDITSPIIKADPVGVTTPSVNINVIFDNNSLLNKIYVNNIEVEEENFTVYANCIIRAVSYGEGIKKESVYLVENINNGNMDPLDDKSKTLTSQNIYVIEKDGYFIIKLNYPTISKTREYKFKEDGEWKNYKDAGILLVKQGHEEILKQEKVMIEDENGKIIEFKGDYYLIDVPINEIMENIYMRWDASKPIKPVIIPSTTKYAKQISVSIDYASSSVKKQYKIVRNDGTETAWIDYTAPITILQNGTIIYARSSNIMEVYSDISNYTVNNIDKEAPTIDITGSLEKKSRKVDLLVTAKDNNKVSEVKYAKGSNTGSYFLDNGISIQNNSVVTIEENGVYTFYAVDEAGYEVVKELEITNIDKEAPNIDINILNKTLSYKTEIEIIYGDSIVKQYKIGNGSWLNYTDKFEVTSYEYLNNNLVDGKAIIYAKGIDEAGNESIIEKEILVLDLDMPSMPVINSESNYPILTLYGITNGNKTTIVFDDRSDITNYYKVDDNEWIEYTNEISVIGSTIYAKSVKKDTGLEINSNKIITTPIGALEGTAYDGNEETYAVFNPYSSVKYRYLYISDEMQQKNVYIKSEYPDGYSWIEFYTEEDSLIEKATVNNDQVYIPENAVKMKFCITFPGSWTIYEISPDTTPEISNEKYYPQLQENGVKKGYNEITINYFQTSIQKMYRINGGSWQEYQNKAIILNIGDKIEAKGIDKNNNETKISSYIATLPADALEETAYDGNEETYAVFNPYSSVKYRYLYISDEMKQKNIYIKSEYPDGYSWIEFYTEEDSLIEKATVNNDQVYIPENAVKMKFCITFPGSWTIYEINNK